MSGLARGALFLAGLFGVQAVISGALSAHGALDDYALRLIEKAVQYQLFHALALIGVVLLYTYKSSRALVLSGCFFTAGILLFCQSLYLKGFFDITLFPMSAPLGGSSLILGWTSLALAAFRLKK